MAHHFSGKFGGQMELPCTKPEWLTLSRVLNDMRDSLIGLSLFLSDHVAAAPSLEHDELAREVEMCLTKIFEGGRKTLG
jgi:hypothetical protein